MIGDEPDTSRRRQTFKDPLISRMNRLFEQHHRLSLGQLLLSTILVTRSTKTVLHCLSVSLPRVLVATIACTKTHLSKPQSKQSCCARSLACCKGPSDTIRHHSSGLLKSNILEKPSIWPVSLILAAIRCVTPFDFPDGRGCQAPAIWLLPAPQPQALPQHHRQFAC